MKISETGRSMVEMLGVLAIMGVLTVGVMLGYRYAMDRILTNSIITGVRARSVIIGQQRVLGQPLNLSEFHPDTEKDLIYGRFEVKAFNNYEYDGEESQAMEVYNIPRRVCENIRMLTFPDETVTLVNGSEMGECITDGERENTGGLHDGGDYFTAEYHNVVTFIFAGLGEACSVNQDCLEGLCCVSLEEGGRGCLPCRSPTDCDPCQEWKDGKCVNKAEGSQCSWTTGATGCCKSGVCGACPNMCLGQSCDTLCQTCDSETGACVNKDNGTDCGTCKRCENGACVSDMTLPGCTPQCTADTDCSGGACCCADGTCSADCCGTPCTTDENCHYCEQCTGGRCVPNDDKGMCSEDGTGSCAMCQGGKCVKRPTKPIKLCNGTIEDCCLWNDNTKCEDETGCCETDDDCDKENCETCNNGKCIQNAKQTVTDCDGNKRTCCSADDTCKTMECQDAQVCTYTPPNTITEDEITACMAQLKCSPGKCPKDMVETITVCYKAIGGCACEEIGTLTGCIKK